MYGWGMQIIYSDAHSPDSGTVPGAIIAVVPLALFCILGLLNFFMLIDYGSQVLHKTKKLDPLVLILTIIAVALAAFYFPILAWAGG